MNNDGIWKDDKLHRQGDADFLERLLSANADDLAARGVDRSYVLNLDAGWGRGKTFFLERFKAQLEASGHLAAYVNAWQDDFADDPLTAVMAAIDKVVSANIKTNAPVAEAWDRAKRTAGKVAFHVAKGIALKSAGLFLTDAVAGSLVSSLGEDDAKAYGGLANEATTAVEKVIDEKTQKSIDDFKTTKATIEAFREQLSSFVSALTEDEKAPPFFILIDELDRCRPPYAIAMLERIKHLFETPNVVFVIATDSGQLQHSIKAVYGSGFNSVKYLKRFFDCTFKFEPPRVVDFVGYLVETSPISKTRLSAPFEIDPTEYMADFFFHTDCDLRAIEQIYNTLRSIAFSWESKASIELIAMLPMLLAAYDGSELSFSGDQFKKMVVSQFVKSWHIVRRERDRGGFEIRDRNINMAEFSVNFWALGQNNLPTINANNGVDQWIASRYRAEYGVLHNHSSTVGKEPDSLVLRYPGIVRQAGRLR